MQYYLDTANLEAIKKYQGVVDGVTSNPAIMAKEAANQVIRLKEICALVPTLPVSGEVIYANSVEQICEDARKLAKIAPNIVLKIPGNIYGLKSIRILKAEGYKLNVTCLMTFQQLAFAAQQGADYVSQFFCRGRDAGVDSVRQINKTREFIEMNGLNCEIIVGSLRTPADIEQALLTRGHILTVSPELLVLSVTHEKTQSSIDEFAKRYEDALKQHQNQPQGSF
jgi:transaldolase